MSSFQVFEVEQQLHPFAGIGRMRQSALEAVRDGGRCGHKGYSCAEDDAVDACKQADRGHVGVTQIGTKVVKKTGRTKSPAPFYGKLWGSYAFFRLISDTFSTPGALPAW